MAERVPAIEDLVYGELALNYTDGALYYKRSDNTIHNLIVAGGPATFTTLTATGQTSLGGVANSESLRAVVPSTTGNYWQFEGSSGDVVLRLNGTSSNISASFVTRGSGNYNFATGTSAGTVQLRVTHTASAVNYLQVTGAATGGSPTLSAQGSDANAGLVFNTKGSGPHTFQTNGTTRLVVNSGGTVQLGYSNSTPCLTAIGQTSQVNGFQVLGAATGVSPVLASSGTDTNIDLSLTPKGTGKLVVTSPIQINTHLVFDTVTTTTTDATANQVLTTLDATVYRAVKFLICAVDSTNNKYHTCEILAIHNNDTAKCTEYGAINIGGVCATFDVEYSPGTAVPLVPATIRLLATPATASLTAFTVALQLLK